MENNLSYGRIRRGPMAGDAFTQIRNTVFRDSRLTAKAMGIFGNISTHRDGWGITPESLATQMRDGVGAIKSGLRELELYGYLRRTRLRNTDGTLGSSVYFITDQPELFDGDGEGTELESSRSEPKVGIPPVVHPPMVEPPVVHPPVDEPTVANRLHKKINSKHTKSQEHSLLPGAPTSEPTPPAASSERETIATPDDTTEALAAYEQALGGPALPAVRRQLLADAAELLAVRPAWWVTDRARELPKYGSSLAKHAAMSRAPFVRPQAATAAAAPVLPPYCGHLDCDEITRLRSTNDDQGLLVVARCPDCHPQTARPQEVGARA